MAVGSKIEWTDATWNPVTGCNKVSPGCKLCYAERLSKRLKATGMVKYRNGFAVTLHPDALEIPLRWRKPRTIFVNSMSDLFHDDVPDQFVRDIFEVMETCPLAPLPSADQAAGAGGRIERRTALAYANLVGC